MMSETAPMEESGRAPTDVLYEFRGQLTKRELLGWKVWTFCRHILRLYLRWAVILLLLTLASLIPQSPTSSGRHIAVIFPLIVFHIYFVAYFLFRLTQLLRAVSIYKSVAGRDNTVRFYPTKVELVSFEGIVSQLPSRLISIRKTGFGISATTLKGSPLFLLPFRVLTPSEMAELPQLYSASQKG